MSVPIHRDPVEYTRNDEVEFLNRLFAQPLPVILACNRVQRRTERAMWREWWKGIAVGLSAVLVALGIAWEML